MANPLEEVKGFSVGQLAALVRAIGGPEAVKLVLKNDGLRKQVVDRITSFKPTFATLLAACNQTGGVDDDFNEKNFPLEEVAPNESKREVYEHHFDGGGIYGIKAIAELQDLGYCLLGGSRRAMEFVAEHPDIQLDHPLIVTTPWRGAHGRLYAPVFFNRDRDDSKPWLYICCLEYTFNETYGWLVLREKH